MDDPLAERAVTGNVSVELADLTLDDELSDIERVARYATSPIALQRLVHVKLMAETARNVGFQQTKESVLPLLATVAADEEYVLRAALAEQLQGLAEVCSKAATTTTSSSSSSATGGGAAAAGAGASSTTPSSAAAATATTATSTPTAAADAAAAYSAIVDNILPVVAKLLGDAQPEVRVAAGEALVSITSNSYIRREDLGPYVLTIILALAHDEEAEDLRMTAAVLLNELAETLGPDLVTQFVTTEVVCLAEDPVFRVRKAAALNLDAICRTCGPSQAAKRILPSFIALTVDDIWGVRKACAESIVAVSKCMDPAVRVNELLPIMERLTSDTSKWVRTAASAQLGPFLATLQGPKITPNLLSKYVRMGMSASDSVVSMAAAAAAWGLPPLPPTSGSSGSSTTSTNSTAGTTASSSSSSTSALSAAAAALPPARTGTDAAEAELAVHCAFSFPAVVVTLGRSRWPDLRHLFIALSRDVQRKVRKPLAHALHELARILGPEITEQDLVPAAELYLRDVDEVRGGLIKSFASFLSALPPSSGTREAYLPALEELRKGSLPYNWRFRRMLAHQLSSFATLFSVVATNEIVVPFALALLQDAVAAVREESVKGVAALINRLGSHDAAMEMDFIQKLLAFRTGSCYRDRVLFVHIAGAVSRDCGVNLFRRHFMEPLLEIAKVEPVRNVRVALATLLNPYVDALMSIEEIRSKSSKSSKSSNSEKQNSNNEEKKASEKQEFKKEEGEEEMAQASSSTSTTTTTATTTHPLTTEAEKEEQEQKPLQPGESSLTVSSSSAAAAATATTTTSSGADKDDAVNNSSSSASGPVSNCGSSSNSSNRKGISSSSSSSSTTTTTPSTTTIDIYEGIEEEAFPMWAREESEAHLHNALVCLAQDSDSEVVRCLPPSWIALYRNQQVLPLPDAKEYIVKHALASSSSSSSSPSSPSSSSNQQQDDTQTGETAAIRADTAKDLASEGSVHTVAATTTTTTTTEAASTAAATGSSSSSASFGSGHERGNSSSNNGKADDEERKKGNNDDTLLEQQQAISTLGSDSVSIPASDVSNVVADQ